MKKRIIAVFTGNRAEYGLQVPILRAIDMHPKLEYRLIVSGAHLDKNFGQTIKEIESDGFKISAEVKINMKKDNLFSTAQAIGNCVKETSKVLERINPNIFVVYADRFEGFAAIIAGTQMSIPTAHIEGGDVMLWNDYIFIGTYRGEDYSDYIVARTNKAGVDFIKEQFPHKKVKSFDLNKSQTNPYDNALHLDCCFQPIGTNKAILHKEGFRDQTEFEWLLNYFGEANCFIISKEEMYNMNSNIFSISEDVIISEKNFSRLNTWLRENGFTVEEVPYAEIAKQEGLLRCSTMPLIRD